MQVAYTIAYVAYVADVAASLDFFERAVKAGAALLKAPASKPWGQVVAYVRCPDGRLVELCTAIA